MVVFGAVALSLVVSLAFLIGGSGSAYEQIGEGGLDGGGDADGAGAGEPGLAEHLAAFPQRPVSSAATLTMSPEALRAEREQEIRQMLQARNARRARRGEAPLDVEAELAALLAEQPPAPQAHDAGLAEEVVQLVVARNERRERQGLQPLDVEAEVQRTLTELNP